MVSKLNRIGTKLLQAVTDAEKTELEPSLKFALSQFEETKNLGDSIRDFSREALPVVGTSTKQTKMEHLGWLFKQIAAKYGAEKPEAKTLETAGNALMQVGKTERGMLHATEQTVFAKLKHVQEAWESLKKDKHRLEELMTDMDGANIKLKSSKDHGTAQERAVAATRAFEAQKKSVEGRVATLPEYRLKQQEAVVSLLTALLEFHISAAKILEETIPNL